MGITKRFFVMLFICIAEALFALDIGDIGNTGDLLGQITNEIGGMNTNPRQLIKGFADALVFAGHGATQRAYGDYDRFAVTVGAMAALRTNEKIFNDKTFSDVEDRLLDEGDYVLGVNAQALVAQCGINFSRWYLGLRVGRSNLDVIENLDFSTLHLGLVGHYQLVQGRGMGNGYHNAFRWRGLSVGAGILYQRAELSYVYTFDNFVDGVLGFTARDPKLDIDMTTTIVTVPLEINTAGLLFYILNVNVGLGADISFGKNEAAIGMNTAVYDADDNLTGTVWARGGGSSRPAVVNPKVMFNLGFKAGPVIIDIPFAYYFIGGFQAGVTLGFCL